MEKQMEMHLNKFFESLSDAELDSAAAIEDEIGKLLKKGLSEETALRFVRAVMLIRKTTPQATVEGVLEVGLRGGLSYLEAVQPILAGGSIKRTGKRGKLAGAGI